MASVQDMLDGLVSGRLTVDVVAADFAHRTWPKPAPVSAAQAWGEADDDAPDPDSWAAVNACSGLTSEQYATLAAAAAAAR